ncbi:MAG TPA: hypothetical protein VGM41_04320 [Chitinophagaceae bacterium]|jgi:hypothetical protein
MIHTLIYIDPGSGSYLIQIIIGAVLGVAVYFKTILLKIKTFFGRRKKEQEPETPEEHD